MKPGKTKAIPVMIALKRARSSERLLVVTSSIYLGALGVSAVALASSSSLFA
jgi:hypothetical protein